VSRGGVGDRLGVFLQGAHVGTLERRAPNRYRFSYSDEVLNTHEEGDLVLSASLPVRADAYPPGATRPFFEGLLPEGSVREIIAAKLKIAYQDGFELLRELGAEVAGAVVILPDGAQPALPGGGAVTWLTEDELAQRVQALPSSPLGVTADPAQGARLSLGGVQGKLVVTRSPNGRFGLPRAGAPSTHILKPGREYDSLVANEAFCLRVATSAGLPAAKAEILTVGEDPWLLVERFDRTFDQQMRVLRVHQEDFCQALAREPAEKYEANGGPSLADAFALIRAVSERAAADVTTLLRATVLNVLLGNSDAHAKNLALLYDQEPGGGRLAPLYDIVSTNVYDLTPNLAMTIGGEDNPEAVGPDAWRQLARDAGLGGQVLAQIREDTERIVGAARATRDLAGAEGWHRPIIDRIVAMAESRAVKMA
jgi:serine/threonine-protein kinase HipA